MDQSEIDKQHENFILKNRQRKGVVRQGKISRELLITLHTGRHQMNLAGSMFKQGPFETPQPGTAMPFLPVPHTCKCSKPSFPWCKTSQTLMTESRQTAPGLRSLQPHVLSQPQPKPHAECRGTSVTHNTPPAAAALTGTARGFAFNRSLLCPG